MDRVGVSATHQVMTNAAGNALAAGSGKTSFMKSIVWFTVAVALWRSSVAALAKNSNADW